MCFMINRVYMKLVILLRRLFCVTEIKLVMGIIEAMKGMWD